MSGSSRPGRLLKAPGNRRRRGMAVTRAQALALQNPAYRPADALQGGSAENRRAPANFLAAARSRSAIALRAELLVGVDHGLAVGARLGEPLRGEALADQLQAGLQGLARRQYFQAVGGELLAVPFVLFLRPRPAARFGGGGNLEQRILRRLVEPIKGRLVHQGDVLREPGLRVVEIGHGLPRLA